MTKIIYTENIQIDPELCKRLDRAIYSDTSAPQSAIDKANLYRHELLDLIGKYNPELAKTQATRALYYLYCLALRIITDEGAHNSERGHANMHTATMQLRNWK